MNKLDKLSFGGEAAPFLFFEWESLRQELLRTRPILGDDGKMHCEIWQYEYEMGKAYPHICGLGWQVNETLYMRNDFPKNIQWYLMSLVNCSLVCGASHNGTGHTKAYRRWVREKQVLRFGSKVVDDYLLKSPNKDKTLNF